MTSKNKVLTSINSEDADRCVDVFIRPDGTYGFEEYRRDAEDGRGWFAVGFYDGPIFESEAAAWAEARSTVNWLEQVMGKTEWLVFDLGGVLFDYRGIEGVSKLTGLSLDEAHDALAGSSAVHALETGAIGRADFGARLVDELGIDISPQEMLDVWASWESGPKPGAIELLTQLRDQRPIACLTNNNAIHWERLRSRYGADRLFTKCYLSHEIGLHKPDPRIFEHVIADLDMPAAQITYFDDRADIVRSAKACGLDAHQVTSPQDIRAVLGMG